MCVCGCVSVCACDSVNMISEGVHVSVILLNCVGVCLFPCVSVSLSLCMCVCVLLCIKHV